VAYAGNAFFAAASMDFVKAASTVPPTKAPTKGTILTSVAAERFVPYFASR